VVSAVIFLLLAFGSEGLRAQPVNGKDSIVLRDTLVESRYTIEHTPLRAGFQASYGWGRYYDASFPAGIQQIGCDQYSMGTGKIFGLRLLADLPLWGDNSAWTLRPSVYAEFQAPSFEWLQGPYRTYDSNSYQPFTIRHLLSTTLDDAGVAMAIDYAFADRWRAEFGANLGIVFDQTYEASLHRVEPGPLFSYDRTRDTTTASGKLSKRIATLPSLLVALNYEAPLSTRLRAEPGLELSLPVGGQKLAGQQNWRFGGMSYWRGIEVQATLALLFDLTPRSEVVPVYVKREVPVPVQRPPEERPKLSASIRAVAIPSNGTPSPVVRMTVEEIRTRNADPVLSYIFFDPASAEFPSRYVTYATPPEAERKFQGSTERHDIKLMDLYREVLNILGDRLRKYPKATVLLVGSTDNTDDRAGLKNGSDAELLALARTRAEAVRNYLIAVWKIDPDRLTIAASILPAKPSPTTTEDGRAEDRRVEFRIQDERVTDPVIVTNIEHLATPDRIDLIPSVETQAGILRTYASIRAGGVELQTFQGDARNVSAEKIWAPSEETLKKLKDSLAIEYDVWDSAGNHAHAHATIPLEVVHVSSDRPERVERFSLILFGFDEANVMPGNDRAIRGAAEMVPKIPVRRVLIQGYTDETGDPAHNDALSEARAAAVRDRLEAMLQERGSSLPTDIHSEGQGSHDLLYDNRLPEGRFFSRTVTITIERAP